ncbi:putative activating signal cointegrator 1 complex subunit 1-like isoform X2 [Capsicum annuum]|nr:putative activating signal cointegrator 1 complex subunit 1-like isoform X2 [Capsicum annuum]
MLVVIFVMVGTVVTVMMTTVDSGGFDVTLLDVSSCRQLKVEILTTLTLYHFRCCYMMKRSRSSTTFRNLGIEKSMFINPKTFHLTVLMLKLSNNDQIKAAAKVLQSVSPKVTEDLEGRPVCIRLTGLACMRGSPEKAYVVHAPLKVTGGEAQLEHACPFLERIINAFTEAGLVLEEDVNKKLKIDTRMLLLLILETVLVKIAKSVFLFLLTSILIQLHATIMNARYRKSKKSSEKTDPFDARAIFAQHGSEEWGECLIREVHLSKRFVYDINGYFHCCASIPFPEEKQGESGIMKNIFHKCLGLGVLVMFVVSRSSVFLEDSEGFPIGLVLDPEDS